MRLSELEQIESNVLTVKQVAQFLGKDPQVIRDQADAEPKYLGLPDLQGGTQLLHSESWVPELVQGNDPGNGIEGR